MKKSFDEVFVDNTKYCTKIKTSDYFEQGEYTIIDQGQNPIAGYTSLQDGVFNDVPAIIFGDHTRIIKYIDEPFFIGADGVKVLKSKLPNSNYKYLYYALKNADIPNTGYNRHFKWLKEVKINYPSSEKQNEIVKILDEVVSIIDCRKQQLQQFDELVKARFVEMFRESKQYPKEALNNNVEQMFIGPFGSALKNEYFVDESDAYCMVYEQKHAIQKTMDLPTRYVNEEKYKELKRFEIHGGDIIVSCRGTIGEIYSIPNDAPMGIMHPSIMKIRLNKEKYCNLFFVFMLEEFMRESIKKANGSGIKMAITATELGKELFVVPPIEKQNEFETFVKQIDKSKFVVHKALDEAQTLFDSLMQEYFG